MSNAIGFREFNEDEYRKFVKILSDEELIKAGKRLRILCGNVVTPIPRGFDKQLKEPVKCSAGAWVEECSPLRVT